MINLEEEFNCGCINHGNYEFKLCDRHRNMILDDVDTDLVGLEEESD